MLCCALQIRCDVTSNENATSCDVRVGSWTYPAEQLQLEEPSDDKAAAAEGEGDEVEEPLQLEAASAEDSGKYTCTLM